MAEMNLWQGGIKIVTQEEIDEQTRLGDLQEGQQKFDTCKNRSDTEVEKVRRTCCSSTKQTGWECNLRRIFKLTPEICATCTVYQKRT